MLMIKHESAWKFQTSSSGGIGVEFVAAEGGSIILKDPSGAVVSFPYGGAGAGLTAGFKLPKIGKIALNVKGKSVGGVIAPSFFPNAGGLYVLDSFEGDDFKRSDITGVHVRGSGRRTDCRRLGDSPDFRNGSEVACCHTGYADVDPNR